MAKLVVLIETVDAIDEYLRHLNHAMTEARDAITQKDANGVAGSLLMMQDCAAPLLKLVEGGVLLAKR
jgi:hypothetical protein